MSHLAVSPARIQRGSGRSRFVPAGLPPEITSPGLSVVMFEANDSSSQMLWLMLRVFESCITMPFRYIVCRVFIGSLMNSFGTMKGPSGPNAVSYTHLTLPTSDLV